jgi:hypothetical protein
MSSQAFDAILRPVSLPSLQFAGLVAAVVAGFVVGGIWFGPVFGTSWLRALAISDSEAAKTRVSGIGLAFVGTLVTAYVLGVFVRFAGATSALDGIVIGFLSWLAFAFAIHLPAANLERNPRKFLIDVGHKFVAYLVMGAILSVWA